LWGVRNHLRDWARLLRRVLHGAQYNEQLRRLRCRVCLRRRLLWRVLQGAQYNEQLRRLWHDLHDWSRLLRRVLHGP
jgi:hypothetical protein